MKSEECLYHAIDFGYYDIVEAFMQHDKNITQMIKRKDSFYPPGKLTQSKVFLVAQLAIIGPLARVEYSSGFRK